MSRTDISHNYSEDLPFVTKVETWNLLADRWFAPTITEGKTLGRSGIEVRSGITTPGYIAKSNTGQLPENSFTYHRTESNRFQGKVSYERVRVRRESAEGTFSDSFMIPPLYRTISSIRQFNLDNEVKQKVLEKVRNTDVNLAVAYAERAETLHTIATMAKRLGQAYNHARRGDLAGAAAALGVKFNSSPSGAPRSPGLNPRTQGRAIASGWLELQYGWLPLMSDIYGAVVFFDKQSQKQAEYVTVKSKRQIEETSTGRQNFSGVPYYDNTFYSSKYIVVITMKMKRANSVLRTSAELGLTNPVLVAWERVPFSFVVDWAIPIGSFLSQFDSSVGWEFQSASATKIQDYFASTERVAVRDPSYVYYNVSGNATSKYFYLTRVPITGFGSLISVPYVKDPASLTHALNALALLTSKR